MASTSHTQSPSCAPTTSSASKSKPIEDVPDTMHALVAREYGPPARVVEAVEMPVPTPAEGQLLVRVAASSLNPLDWHFVTGTPYLLRLMNGLRSPKRIVHGADVAGVVVGLGPGVEGFALGDRIFGESGGGGGLGEYTVVSAAGVVPIADDVSFEAAAATPVAGLTALQGLVTHGALAPGQRVLINGAAGGVGTFAVQIATAMGAEVTGVCSTRNVAMVRSLGAEHVVDYTVDDFVAMAEGRGDRYDLVLDNVGNRSPRDCLGLLTDRGRYVAVSGPKDNPWLDPMRHIVKSALTFWRAEQTFHQFTASPNVDDLARLGQLLASGDVVPRIHRTIGVEREAVVDALTEIGGGHAPAKIVVSHGQSPATK